MSKKTVYVVQEFGWEYNDEYFEIITDTPIKAFATLKQAESHKRILEREARRKWEIEVDGLGFPVCFDNQSGIQPFSSITSLTWEEFVERVDLFSLPPFQYADSMGIDLFEEKVFWKAVSDLPEEQYHAFFDLLDGLNFYEIITLEVAT
jgi:hypothetical protein